MTRFVVVGLGARSRIWLRVLGEHPACSIVGLVEADPDRLATASEASPVALTGRTLTEVLEQVEADVALLCTPPGGRHDQIATACSAGLAILAEKPLADCVADAEAHVAAAEEAGVSLAVGLNFRYLGVTRALKKLFAPDRLGPPEFGRFTYERWRDGRQAHLNTYPLTMSQPMLWEQSIHHFDLMRFVYDAEPVRVSARTFNPSWSMYDGDANVGALITFTGGIEVTYQGTWAGNWKRQGFEWRTECRKGVALQREMFGDLAYARRDDEELTPVPLPAEEPWVDDARALLDDFVDHLEGDGPLPCPGSDHLQSLRMVDACIQGSSRGETIHL